MSDQKQHVLILRSCKADGSSYNGFKWPEKGDVACPEGPCIAPNLCEKCRRGEPCGQPWKPTAECGNGLHGLLWGKGDWSLLNREKDARWQVIKVLASEVVAIDSSKVKYPRGEVVFTGHIADAVAMVLADQWHIQHTVEEAISEAEKSKTHNPTAASSGSRSTAASSGYGSTAASSGSRSTAASSGDGSTAASSGYGSTAASSGYGSTAASSGYGSTAASSGSRSTAASSGYGSTAASSGETTLSMAAGLDCIVSAGKKGCFASAYWDEKAERYRILIAYVGEDGIKPDTKYIIRKGKFTEV